MSDDPSNPAAVGQPDTERMRAALARALPDAGSADAAVEMWRAEYSGLPGFGVVRFVQELGKLHGLADAQRRDLRMSLFREIYSVVPGGRSAGAGGDSTKPAAAPEAADAKPASTAASPLAQVGHAMLVALADTAGRDQASLFAQQFRSFCDETGGLAEALRAPIRAWDGNSRSMPVIEADADSLRLLVHAAYNALCDAVGPSRADKGLSTAVRRAEALDAAADASPGDLL